MNQDFVHQIDQVPTLPTVLTQLMDLLNRDDSDAKQVEHILVNDQALTFKILAMANSAHYGFTQQIDSVQRAVVAIGFAEVRDICMGAGLMSFMSPNSYQDPEAAAQLWLHSLAVAEASRLAAKLCLADAAIAYTGGLLHDLGRVVLAAFFPDYLADIFALAKQNKTPLSQAEKELGMEHTAIGKALAEHWGLPEVYAHIIAGHHQPGPGSPHIKELACVYLADVLVLTHNIGDTRDAPPRGLNQAVLKKAGLDKSKLLKVSDQLKEKREEIESLWQAMVK